VGATSQLADLMDFCEFSDAPKMELARIMEMIPESTSQLTDLPALAEAIATRVNGIELSLG
jgi:hypothetical protein